MQGMFIVLLNLFMATAAGRSVAAFLLVNLVAGMAFVTDCGGTLTLGEGHPVDGGGDVFGATRVTILTGASTGGQPRYRMRSTVTTDAIWSLAFASGACRPMGTGGVGVGFLGMALSATTLGSRFQRFQTVRAMAVGTGP